MTPSPQPGNASILPALLSLCLFVVLGSATNARAADEAGSTGPSSEIGFKPIFNGRDLTGWDGDPRLWSVHDGVIRGQTTLDKSAPHNTFLIWRGGLLRDFVLKFKFHIHDGNSGIQYRSQDRGDWIVSGYQGEIANDRPDPGIGTGFLYHERGRGDIARVGEFVVISPDGKKTVVEKLADANALRAAGYYKNDDWNEYTIMAQGSHLVHLVNGIQTIEMVDNDTKASAREGILALQIHAGDPMLVEFKDIRLMQFGANQDAPNSASTGNGNFTVGPDYHIDPDLTDRGNPKGKAFAFTMALADSKIFRGDDATLDPVKKPVRKERKISVYVPAAYKDGTPAPILIIHDGPGQLNLVRNALDNLTLAKDPNRSLPAFIAIAVENGGNDGKKSERGLEYDTMSDRLARFIHDEVLPAVLSNAEIKAAYPHIAFTDDPWGRAVIGCSSGGAAALTMGWFRPDLFRRLIAYSGTFVDQQDDDAPEEAKYPFGAWEYHSGMKLIENSEKKPLRIFTHVSENDLRPKDLEETHHNWVMAGQRTSAALEAKGYDHRFVFSLGTGHCDRRVFELTLADTLVWAWRGYHAD